jgi:VWFA-related protein
VSAAKRGMISATLLLFPLVTLAQASDKLQRNGVAIWQLPTARLNSLLSAVPPTDAARYDRLRQAFIDFGCNSNALTEPSRDKKAHHRNLIRTLPGDDKQPILVSAWYRVRPIYSGGSTGWPEAIMLRGLRQRDFTVTEDGTPQRILSFEVHTMDAPKADLAPANLAPGTFINLPSEPERGPLYILVYDMIHIRGLDQQMFAREELIKFVKSRPAGTRFALIALSDGIHLVQGFTTDKQILIDDVDAQHHTPHMPRAFLYAGNYYEDNPQAMAMFEIVDYVRGLPGRKNVIWMASSFDLPLFATSGAADQQRAAQQLLNLLADQQISIYPIDTDCVAGGIGKMSEYQLEDATAGATGGRAYYSTNDLVDALDKATEAGSVYYSLSYNPTNSIDNGQFRKIDVKLSKKGYQLFYRRGYYALSDELAEGAASTQPAAAIKHPGDPAPDDLYVWMRHGMPMNHDIVFQAKLHSVGTARLATAGEMADLADYPAYFRTRKRNKTDITTAPLAPVLVQRYTIGYSMPTRQFYLQPGMKRANRDTLEFAAAAYDRDGNLLNGIVERATSTRKGAADAYRAVQTFNVPALTASISLAVRDLDTGRIGNMEIPLDHPIPER